MLLPPAVLFALRLVDDTAAALLASPIIVVTALLVVLVVGIAMRASAARSRARAIGGGAATLAVGALLVLPMLQVMGRRPCPERMGPDRGLQVAGQVFAAWRNGQPPPAALWQSASLARTWSARVDKLLLIDHRLVDSGCWDRLAPVATKTTWHEFRATVQGPDGERLSKVVTVHTHAARGEWRVAEIEGP